VCLTCRLVVSTLIGHLSGWTVLSGAISPPPLTSRTSPHRGHLGTGYRGTPATNLATVARPSFSATAVSNSNLGVPSHRPPISEVGSSLPLDSLTTWQCSPQDGSVSRNGVTVGASIPCNWGNTGPNRQAEATGSTTCAGAEMLAAIEKKELDRRDLQVVVVRHAEDISWSEPFAAVRTVYEKPGSELPILPLTSTSAGAGPAAPEAASVVLPNVGKEQHAYLTHIVRNYDSLANRTVFLHGKKPTCGFFLADPKLMGNHLLTNVSVLDYLTAEGGHGKRSDLFIPLTGRANHDLTLSSFRSSFADGLDPRPRVPRPVTAHPAYGDQKRKDEDGGGDRWLQWEVNDLPKFAKEITVKQGVLRADEMVDFTAFFKRVVGRAPPAVLYFTQGAQFAASRAALRSTPKETYQWILGLVEGGHLEVTFYLEIIWLTANPNRTLALTVTLTLTLGLTR